MRSKSLPRVPLPTATLSHFLHLGLHLHQFSLTKCQCLYRSCIFTEAGGNCQHSFMIMENHNKKISGVKKSLYQLKELFLMICTKETITQCSFLNPTEKHLWAPVTGAFCTADEVVTNTCFTYDWYIFSLIRLSDISVVDKLCQF